MGPDDDEALLEAADRFIRGVLAEGGARRRRRSDGRVWRSEKFLRREWMRAVGWPGDWAVLWRLPHLCDRRVTRNGRVVWALKLTAAERARPPRPRRVRRGRVGLVVRF
jgi:hypothetical protein